MKRAALKLALVTPLGVPGAAGRIDCAVRKGGQRTGIRQEILSPTHTYQQRMRGALKTRFPINCDLVSFSPFFIFWDRLSVPPLPSSLFSFLTKETSLREKSKERTQKSLVHCGFWAEDAFLYQGAQKGRLPAIHASSMKVDRQPRTLEGVMWESWQSNHLTEKRVSPTPGKKINFKTLFTG